MNTAELGSVSNTVMGQAPPGSACNKDGNGTVFVKAGEFSGRQPLVREWTTQPQKLAKSGDVLVCVVGATAGKINLGIDCAIGRSVAAIRPNERYLDTSYLHYFMHTQTERLRSSSQGLAQGVITREMIAQLEIPLPPLDEQRRIAAILDKADALRRKRKRALDLVDSLTQSIFLEMFGDPVSNPRAYTYELFGDVGQLDRGVSKHRPRNDPALLNGDHPLIQTGDVANSGGYIRSYSSTYSNAGLKQSKKWPAGTLCITIAANIAQTGILTFPACFPDSVVGFVHERPGMNEYIRVWLAFLRETLERTAPAVAQKNINLEILRGLKMMMPPYPMIAKFAEMMERRSVIDSDSRALAAWYDAMFNALQHRAFSGQL